MEKFPLVSIIALNYNQLDLTMDFIQSMSYLSYPNYEIIIVDNGSTIDPTQPIHDRFPHVRVIRSASNLGFTGGHNLGMREARGDFFFNVNNDTEIYPDNADLIEQLIAPFLNNEKVGAVSPKIKYFSHPNIIQYAGYTPMNPFTGRGGAIGANQEDKGQYDQSGPTWFAHGAAMMVSRKLVEQVGMFFEPFFIYYEELDWSARITKAGYQIIYQHKAVIYHKVSMTVGKDSPFKAYLMTRNRIWYMRRNISQAHLLLFLAYFIFLTTPVTVLRYLKNRQTDHLKSFWKAVVWHLERINPAKLQAA
ncbi:glycosyltransferase family 2 protein [Rhodoflexus sp.]